MLEGAHEGRVRRFSLSDFLKKWVVLFFYPADFTFVCPTELLAFEELRADFSEADAEPYLAAEAAGLEVGLEVDVVLAGADVGRKAEARRPLGLRHGIAALAGVGTACKSGAPPPPWSRPSAAGRRPARLARCWI